MNASGKGSTPTRAGASSATFRSMFPPKPIIGVLHLLGSDPTDRLERARREVAIYVEGGVDAVLVEDYFGTPDDVVAVLDWIAEDGCPIPVGVNVLEDPGASFDLARTYGLKLVQVDSVAGHLEPDEDETFARDLERMRLAADVPLVGGVRFKYQPYLSGRSLREDLELGASRSDAIVVTGEGTGQATPLEKLRKFRSIVGNAYPLLVGSGLTPESCRAQLELADGAIVGSYFKHDHRDRGELDLRHVRRLMGIVEDIRGEVASGGTHRE